MLAVGMGREGVADVMEQRRRHVLLVLAGPERARGRLERVLQPADLQRALELLQRGDRVHQPARQLSGVLFGVGVDQPQVGLGHVRHAGVGNGRHGQLRMPAASSASRCDWNHSKRTARPSRIVQT